MDCGEEFRLSQFGTLSGLWGLLTILLFIQMVRISYKIERKSNPGKFERWPLRYANPFGVALNINVSKDAETQGMRRQLLGLMALIGVLFALFILFVTSR